MNTAFDPDCCIISPPAGVPPPQVPGRPRNDRSPDRIGMPGEHREGILGAVGEPGAHAGLIAAEHTDPHHLSGHEPRAHRRPVPDAHQHRGRLRGGTGERRDRHAAPLTGIVHECQHGDAVGDAIQNGRHDRRVRRHHHLLEID